MNLAPKFLTLDQVLALHQMQINQFGGSHGVRDKGLLLSALGQPEAGFDNHYFHEDLYAMAAAYRYNCYESGSKPKDKKRNRRIFS